MKWKVIYDNGATVTVNAENYQEAQRKAAQYGTRAVQSIGQVITPEEAESQQQQCVEVWENIKQGNGFNPERSVLICADSWAKLRRGDVFRLFDSHDPEHWQAIYKCLKKHRPELSHEASECMADLEADMYGGMGGGTNYDASYGL